MSKSARVIPTKIELSFDGREELYEKIRTLANQDCIHINQYIIELLSSKVLQLQSKKTPEPKTLSYEELTKIYVTETRFDVRTQELKQQIQLVRMSLMNELKRRDDQIAILAEAITQLESQLQPE